MEKKDLDLSKRRFVEGEMPDFVRELRKRPERLDATYKARLGFDMFCR